MATALVTGAAGFLGRALVRELVARGHTVRALVREGTDASGLDGRTELVRGDATDPGAVRRAVEGRDLVFHLAGVRRGADRASFFRVNADATRLLLDACLAAGAARARFVLAGSLAAAGPSRDGRSEEEPLEPAEWYGESKAEAERIALSFSGRLPVAVARPPRIMGPGDRENLLFFRIAARGVVLRFLGPERPLSWIDVDDCARGFALLGEHPAAAGQAFFLASRDRTTVEDLQRDIARALAVRVRTVPVPGALLTALAAGADAVTRATGVKLPLNRKLARQVLAPGWTCRTEKAERLLGFAAPTRLTASIERAARSYRELGWL
ncbi:MAG TPA: NAD-dependent epimerase/dehydratase family protein [Anaeromyxobacteraceae bacterium]|nr:NAD-dependent epimerase/dehydratase family protein [Anaeromyxobacteraceae bacterium]